METSMSRLSTPELVASILIRDIDMPTSTLISELSKHHINLGQLVTGHFRSIIRAVLLYLDEQGLLDLSGRPPTTSSCPRPQSKPICKGCGQHFAARSNARFCSSACRQRAYRRRVTDNQALRFQL
jgi:hypothetical protein